MSKEITVYGPEESILPLCLFHNENGSFVFNKNLVIEGGKDPEYHFVFDYGTSQEAIKKLVPKRLRIIHNTRPDLTFLGLDSPTVAEEMAGITEIANDRAKSPDNFMDREEYRNRLAGVYRMLIGKVGERLDIRKALFFTPKNGGIFVRQVYEQEGIPKENFFDYKLSRVLVRSNKKTPPSLMVGMVLGQENPDVTSYDQIVFGDDCLASKVSADTTLRWIATQFTKAGKRLSDVNVIIAVSAGSQMGLTSLLSPESKRDLGFKSIEAIAAMPVYHLNKHFYLMSIDGKRYIVGDMGKWTLPKFLMRNRF